MNPTTRKSGDPVFFPSLPGSQVAPSADGVTGFADSEKGGAITFKGPNDASYSALSFGLFGDGSDGACAFDGAATVLGLAPSSSVYTLTRDIFCSSITLSAGVTIKTASFRIFCTGATTVPATASINCDGNAAVTTTAGAATNTSGSLGCGTAGGAGGVGNNAGSPGTNHANGFPGGTGAGGAGGTDGTHAGAAAGTFTALAAAKGGARYLPALLTGQIFGTQTSGTASLISLYQGGTGGGGAGCDNAATSGGAGGGGGGVLVLCTNSLVLGGTVSCNGGAGSAGISAANNAGGGGGGGGGVCIVAYCTKTGSGTITATGGTGGAKAGAAGVVGSAGAGGVVVTVQM